MIFCVVTCCRCMYWWEILGLSFISEICMDCHLLSLGIHILKSNSCLSCKAFAWKLKSHVNCSVCLFSDKFIWRSNLISCIIKKCIAGFLINKGTDYCVFTSDFNTIVTHGIDQSDIFVCRAVMTSIFRIKDGCSELWNIYGLVSIGNICMRGNGIAVQLKVFIDY